LSTYACVVACLCIMLPMLRSIPASAQPLGLSPPGLVTLRNVSDAVGCFWLSIIFNIFRSFHSLNLAMQSRPLEAR
jgi:hypothetical protein